MIVGFDLSTTSVGVAKVSLDGEYIWSGTVILPADATIDERARSWAKAAPRGIAWDDVSQVVIEQPMGVGPDVLTWLGAMIGGTIAHIPWQIPVLIVKPQEWRSWLGWPRLKRADAKRQAITWAEAKTGRLLPEDEAEAVCMCLAALTRLNQAADAA